MYRLMLMEGIDFGKFELFNKKLLSSSSKRTLTLANQRMMPSGRLQLCLDLARLLSVCPSSKLSSSLYLDLFEDRMLYWWGSTRGLRALSHISFFVFLLFYFFCGFSICYFNKQLRQSRCQLNPTKYVHKIIKFSIAYLGIQHV